MELNTLSLSELRRLLSRVSTEIKKRTDSTRRVLLKQIKKMAADEGLSLGDLVGEGNLVAKAETKKRASKATAKKSRPRKPVPIKYQHPDILSLAWSGRGRRPQWIIDWVNQGNPIERLEK